MTTETVREALQRLDACAESLPLWEAVADRPIAEIGASWTIEAALDLARRDGAGPRVGALGWLESHGLVPHVLDGANLRGARLVDARLDGARLDGASLDHASLAGTNLAGASLVGARLDGASLNCARLDGARLVDARLNGVYRPEGGIAGWTPDTEGRLRRG